MPRTNAPGIWMQQRLCSNLLIHGAENRAEIVDASNVQGLGFFPFFAVPLWAGITMLLSWMGGWNDLAQRFRAADNIPGEKFSGVSGSMSRGFLPVNYGGCLNVTVGDSGLRIGILFLFRIFHPALFIPWSYIISAEKRRSFFLDRAVIKIRGFDGSVSLAGKAGQAVFEAYARRARG